MPDEIEQPRAVDVLIVDATGGACDHASRLRVELERLGLHAKLGVVPAQGVPTLPAELRDDASRTAYCLVLTVVREERDGVAVEETMYVAIPAPAHRGQSPVYAPAGHEPGPDRIEMGRIEGDVAPLATRIAERVWERHG